MKIGIDFGTTYTKIAYLDSETNQLRLFCYPKGSTELPYIPTAVAYTEVEGQQAYSIGKAARMQALHQKGVTFCDNFKILLPYQERDYWLKRGWPVDAPEPQDVVGDYLRGLLCESSKSFERQVSPIELAVVSVPQSWQKQADNPGTETLQEVLKENFDFTLDHLQSEPVCAAAYCAIRYKDAEERNIPFNLLVCDVGGGTVDMALCEVQYPKIKVRLFGGSTGWSGVAFDRRATEIMWESVHASPPETDNPEFLKLLRDFEEMKIHAENTYDKIQINRSQNKLDAVIYTLDFKYELSLRQVEKAFQPIKEDLLNVLTTMKNKADERGLEIDRIAIVGGFGQFPLVQETIRGFWNPDELSIKFDDLLGREQGAIAMGAALIANGIIDPQEYYPHTILVQGLSRNMRTIIDIPLIKAGKMPSESGPTEYFARYEDHGEKVICNIREEHIVGHLPVFIQEMGVGEKLPCFLREESFPPPGRYYVGVRIDHRTNLTTLLFESVTEANNSNARRIEYPLRELRYRSLIIDGKKVPINARRIEYPSLHEFDFSSLIFEDGEEVQDIESKDNQTNNTPPFLSSSNMPENATVPELHIGDKLAINISGIHQVRIENFLGKGVFANVWQVQDEATKKFYALKHFNLERQTSEEKQRSLVQIRREGQVNIHSQYVVQCYGVVKFAQDNYGILLEYIPGLSLDKWLKAHPKTSWQKKKQLYLKILEGVQAIHAAGMAHRDIKPGNILVMKNGNPKIIDFGFVKFDYTDIQESQVGQIFGSLPYLDPTEVYRSIEEYPDSVIYKLTAVGVKLLQGEGVPEYILSILRALEFKEFFDTEGLVAAIEEKIPPAEFQPYKKTVLKYARQLDIRCDVYSIGILLYTIIMGADPWEANGIVSLKRFGKFVEQPEYRNILDIDRTFAFDGIEKTIIEEVLRKSTMFEAKARIQTIEEIIFALKREPLPVSLENGHVTGNNKNESNKTENKPAEKLLRKISTNNFSFAEYHIFQQIYQNASELMDTSNMYIALYDKSSNMVRFPLWYSDHAPRIVDGRALQPRSDKMGFTESIIYNKKSLFLHTKQDINDWYKRTSPEDFPGVKKFISSWIGVPMLIGKQILGVIAVYSSSQEYSYSEDHVKILQAIANLAVIALGNVQFDDTKQRHEQDKEQEASHLVDIQDIPAKRILNALDFANRVNNLSGTIPLWVSQIKDKIAGLQEFQSLTINESLKNIDNTITELIRMASEIWNKPSLAININMTEMLHEMLTQLRVQYYSQEIENGIISLKAHIQTDLYPIGGQASKLSEAIYHILSNGMEAVLAEGVGELTVQAENYADAQIGDEVKISITDSGAGIPEEFRERLFTPLFSTKTNGRGLGLWRAKVIVEEFGGSIDVSFEERGTTFTLLLPSSNQEA